MSMKMVFEWKHKEKNNDGNTIERYLNIPISVDKSTDGDYGYKAHLICNKCEHRVEQFYICSECGDKEKIGEINKKQDEKTKTIYHKDQLKSFMENEVDKTIRVIREVEVAEVLQHTQRMEKTFEIYNNDKEYITVIGKIYNWLQKHNKAFVVSFGYNSGKSNNVGGFIHAGQGKLILVQLLDYRLIRQPKQVGLPIPLDNEVVEVMNMVSENKYPEIMESFLEAIKTGEEIKITVKQKPKIVVETSWLE